LITLDFFVGALRAQHIVTEGKSKGQTFVMLERLQVDKATTEVLRYNGTWHAPSSITHTCLEPSQP